MDNTAIEGLVPVFNGWLKQYGQKVGTSDVNDSKKILTISDLGDLIEHRIDSAYDGRLEKVWSQETRWLLNQIGQPGLKVDDDTSLRKMPLNLSDAQISNFRDELNTKIATYGIQVPITSAEMGLQNTLGGVKQLLGKELENSNAF